MGLVNKAEKNIYRYRVSQPEDMKVIIEHFTRYPLITQKQADFILFKEAVNILLKKEHLTIEGVNKLVSIKASLGNGLSDELKGAFPDIVPVIRPSPACGG